MLHRAYRVGMHRAEGEKETCALATVRRQTLVMTQTRAPPPASPPGRRRATVIGSKGDIRSTLKPAAKF